MALLAETSSVSYPGLFDIISATATISDGVRPSMASITCAAGQTPEKDPSKLEMTYSERLHKVVWEECVVKKATEQTGISGRTTTFLIMDRRWRWKHGEPANGLFNVRRPNGDIVKDTEKTPQEIARFLLSFCLGEVGFSVADLPDNTRPFFDWINAAPDGALSGLLSSLGCTIVPEFQPGDTTTFAIRRLMVGGKPPGVGKAKGHALMSNSGSTFGSAARPNYIMLTGGLVKFQAKFRLEAVGLDVDDEIKPIGKLSYRPKLGFGPGQTVGANVLFDTGRKKRTKKELKKHIELAESTVYRWYRITELAEGGWDVGRKGRLGFGMNELEDILPLLGGLVETEFNKVGIESPKKPYVEGVHRTSSLDDAVTEPGTILTVPFMIFTGKGIIAFSKPVVSFSPILPPLGAQNAGFDPEDDDDNPAVLRLTVAFNSVDGLGNRIVTTQGLNIGPGKRLYHTIRRPEIVQTVLVKYDGDKNVSTETNDATIGLEMDVHIDKAKKQFLSDVGSSVTYRGLVPITMDGAIRQITYSISGRGTSTRVGWNSKHDPKAPDEGLLKMIEKIENLEQIVEFVERDRLNWERVTHLVEN